MDDFEKAKLKAGLLKECDNELKEAQLIVNEIERERVKKDIFTKYQLALLKLGESSWVSLLDLESDYNNEEE